jgi:signal transduction histidine kinase
MGLIIYNIIQSNDRRIFIKIIRLARIAEHRKILLSQVNMASKAKTDFLATISHEVRTPLHGIMGMMAFLNSKNLLSAPADKKIAEAIKISANRLLATLNDILDFAQSEDGRIMQLIPSVFTIKEILFDCNSIFENTASLKGVDLLFHVDEENGGICFYADKNKITRVIINLISNAIKFTPAGGSVNVKAMVVMNNLDKINCVGIFEIIDTGAGISENNLRNIFQAFFQVNSGDSRTHQGNGLGLAICQQIVSAMNGEIHVKSVQQEGTVFRVSIPLSAANAKISQM